MKTKTILIIEDEPAILESTRDLLLLHNYIVFTAFNGAEGLVLASEHIPDLIICDIMMPGMDGYTLLEKIRELPALKLTSFIYTSAKVKREDVRKGMDLGADDYLTKPYKASELLKSIEARIKRYETLESEKIVPVNDELEIIATLKTLTKSENNILLLAATGLDNNAIAARLFISRKTVENHRSHILEKLNLKGNNALLRFVSQYKDLIQTHCIRS